MGSISWSENVIVELKAVKTLKRVHESQMMAYLKGSRLRVALLINFGGRHLKEGIRRIRPRKRFLRVFVQSPSMPSVPSCSFV